MKAIDKAGRQLYPSIFSKLQVIGHRLEELGYIEHPVHFNLFWRKTPRIYFFADMRGTEEIPIWKVPVPLFFVHSSTTAPEPIKEFAWRAALIEVQRLNGVDMRLSFPQMKELAFGGPFARRLHHHFETMHVRIFQQYPWQPRQFRRWQF